MVIPVGSCHTPVSGYPILGPGIYGHKLGSLKQWLWHEPTGKMQLFWSQTSEVPVRVPGLDTGLAGHIDIRILCSASKAQHKGVRSPLSRLGYGEASL